ncbi:MAG: hypothetical protein GX877_00830 [Bacteroidales bacterium]|nr:hypothetical protein [Bacteroidales bacterium]
MKVNEVPQDNAFLQEETEICLRDRYYALDEEGKFREVPSVGWKPKNAAIQFAWNNREEEADKIREQVVQGKLSPLAYHMERLLMTPAILSKYAGLSRRKIVRYCKPKYFSKIKPEELSCLAVALNINVEELISID